MKYALHLCEHGMHVLEIGPASIPSDYQNLCAAQNPIWDTLDINDTPGLTYPLSSPEVFAIPSETYDLVVAGQVLEHVERPWRWLPEIARILKPGGHVVIINPVSWCYHKALIDCWRIYPDGMRVLCREASLQVEFSQCESLEAPGYRRYRPGNSAEYQSPRRRRFAQLFGRWGWPVERSYDTITIAKRPEAN